MNTSLTSVIPQSYLDELIQIRDDMTNSYWKIGDIANAICAFSIANRLPADKMRVYAAVGLVVGKAQRSVRLYSFISNFYPYSARKEYEVLPYYHFVLAAQFESGTRWKEVLDTAMDFIDNYGVPPTLEKLSSALSKAVENSVSPSEVILQDSQKKSQEIADKILLSIATQNKENLAILNSPRFFIPLEEEVELVVSKLPALVQRLHESGNEHHVGCAELIAQMYTIAKEVEDIINGKITVSCSCDD